MIPGKPLAKYRFRVAGRAWGHLNSKDARETIQKLSGVPSAAFTGSQVWFAQRSPVRLALCPGLNEGRYARNSKYGDSGF